MRCQLVLMDSGTRLIDLDTKYFRRRIDMVYIHQNARTDLVSSVCFLILPESSGDVSHHIWMASTNLQSKLMFPCP